MSEEKKIKRINTVQIVGTLVETGNLKFDAEKENEKTKLKGAINRVDLSKPAFVIDVNGQKIGVSPLPTYKQKKEDGKIVDNKQFQALEKVMGYEVGTRVMVKGSISVSAPYKSKSSGNVIEPVSIQMFSMSSTGVPEEDYAEGKVSGYIKKIKDETNNEDEETGRLIIDFWLYDDYNKLVSPFPLIVEEDIANDFNDTFDNGNTAILDFDIVSRKVGRKESDDGFGSRKSKVIGGFNVIEYSVFNGNSVDDESEYYIDEDVFKNLFKAHEQKKEEAKNASNNNEGKSNKGLGSARTSHVEDVDDDENPFDD